MCKKIIKKIQKALTLELFVFLTIYYKGEIICLDVEEWLLKEKY